MGDFEQGVLAVADPDAERRQGVGQGGRDRLPSPLRTRPEDGLLEIVVEAGIAPVRHQV
jgi:hypothetical protein